MSKTQKASIVAPLMRFVSVRNVAESVAFYRDVLGFVEQQSKDEKGVGTTGEVSLGPARIQFRSKSADSFRQTIVFFETDAVAAMHDEIRRRGGEPGALERVNWIKMEMFELRDPDGNVLWFGQSFDQPHDQRPRSMLQEMLPHLPVDDVELATEYYQEVLGFKINYTQHDLSVMYRDKATLLLIARTPEYSGIGSCTVYVANADQLHDEFVEKGAKVLSPPVSRPWGLRDFTVVDHDGNKLIFAQPFE